MTVQALEALRGSRSGFSKVTGSVSDFDLGLFWEFGDLRSHRLSQTLTSPRGHWVESSIDWSCLKGENESLVYTYGTSNTGM